MAVIGVTMEVSAAEVMTVPPVGAVETGVVASGSVVGAVVTTTGVSAGGAAAVIVTAVVTGGTMGPASVWVQLSSLVVSRLYLSVYILIFSEI